ncbi:MAG: undecaprenyl-diphosphatase, partial [Nodularia sp. (in: Bacteria)]
MAISKRQWFGILSAASAIFSVTAFPIKVLSTQPNPGLDGVQQQMNILQAIFLGFVQGMTEFL